MSRRPPRRHQPLDRPGSGTLLVAGVMGVVGAAALVAMLLAGYLVTEHRARGAADLAALSAAAAYQQGADPCAQARRTAAANGARVARCDRVGDAVDFVVSVVVVVDADSRVPGLPRTVPARANAGPAAAGG